MPDYHERGSGIAMPARCVAHQFHESYKTAPLALALVAALTKIAPLACSRTAL